ncbi:MAG: hypothetical protein K8T26_19240 [Lentisphaerae bacterium]|nr:hypothetical protein [Lentisphaerota bacterium]
MIGPIAAVTRDGRGPWVMILPAVIGLVWMVTLYVRQAVYDVPVPTKPLPGDVVPASGLDLLWNESADGAAEARVQVATDRRFRNIVFEERCACFSLRRTVPLIPGATYYWRVQRVRPGHTSPWTLPVRFEVEP